MSFFNRLFARKGKSTAVASPSSLKLRRSLTEPAATPTSMASGGDSDPDTFEASSSAPMPRMARRAGVDLRCKTSNDIGHSVRSSASSTADDVARDTLGCVGHYRQLRPVHRSRLHTIMSAQDRQSKRMVVLKAYSKQRLTSTARQKMEAEVQHLRALQGTDGVVRFIDFVEDDSTCYIVMERCPGTTLIEAIANSGGRMHERQLVVDVLIPLLRTLADLHAHGIVHRQLKPEHIMVSLGQGTSLLDFAEAVDKKQRCLNNRTGPLEYMAPEVADKPTADEVFHQVLYNGMSEEELPQYDEKADIFSLGAIVFEALTGCQPFMAEDMAGLLQAQQQLLGGADTFGMPLLLSGRGLSSEACDFVRQAMQVDPLARPSAEALLQHALVKRYWSQWEAARLQAQQQAQQQQQRKRESAPGSSVAVTEGLAPMARNPSSRLATATAGTGAAAACVAPIAIGSKRNIILATSMPMPAVVR